MEKSSGTYELVLWGESFVSMITTNVTVNLGASYSSVNVYDITAGGAVGSSTNGASGTSPTATHNGSSSFTVPLKDHIMIVEFHN